MQAHAGCEPVRHIRRPTQAPACCGYSTIAFIAALAAAGAAHAAEEPTQLAPTVVVGTTPLPGIDLPRDQVPANLQTLDGRQVREAGGVSLGEAMQRRLGSVTVNEIQGNPYQADVNYRGFTVSPLLGTPQGLSVYVDGVRVNEGFGDVVNWDLIPRAAIASMAVVPGSNPLYGLNTLGGALALRTKRGDTHPGTEIEAEAGSFDRRMLSLQHGGSKDALNWFVSAEGMKEDGWRDHSPSEVAQFFGRLGWKSDRTDLSMSVIHANTDLIGNGLVPESLRRRRDEAIFTHPDQTRNRMSMLTLAGTHWLSDVDQLSASAYVRRTRTRTLNGDGNDDYEDALEEDPAFDLSGVLNRTATNQRAYGVALQWTRFAGAHQFAVGASHDRSHADFRQTAQEGRLTANRGVEVDEDAELENSLSGRTRTTSIYLTDSVALGPTVQLTGALRYNRTRVINRDRLEPGEPDNLDGDYTYHKLNPALGLTWQASPALTVYGGYSQGNRAPTPIELGCANPEKPCTLPNALASDPFLEQVVARTFELGVRGRLAGGMQWNASVFRTTSRDDILFVGTSTSAGYFTNFGKTRREGVELGIGGNAGALEWQVNYNWLRATFQSSACIVAENNSTAESDPGCGEEQIRVGRGDRIPGLPEHGLKLALSWRANDDLRVGAGLVAYSGQYVRGNENNRHKAGDGFRGRGELPGYAVVNLSADYRLSGGWTLFGRVDNVFDQRYATAGALAENPFTGPGNAFQPDTDQWRSEQFVAPGAPRAAWVGLRYAWGR
ncbi:TonB-dependent receptor [Thauera sinica]|nr:TonB-dependent receptor [Thauera sp. K11]